MSALAIDAVEAVEVDHDAHETCAVCETTVCPECTPTLENQCGHLGLVVCPGCDPAEACGACYLDRPRGGFLGWSA